MRKLYPKNKSIAIVGTTASGKTLLSIKLAKKFNGEIINSDSQIVYEGFNIGTDKPKKDNSKSKEYVVSGVVHHLIDFLSPEEQFTMGLFKKMSRKKIEEVAGKKKLPIVVGGSPLYTDAIVYDYRISNSAVDMKLRNRFEKLSLPELLKRLWQESPTSFELVDRKNKRRVIRALELAQRGEGISRTKKRIPDNFMLIGVEKEREQVYKKIDQRVEMMIRSGLVKEARNLLKKYGKDIPAMKGIGYRQLIPYFDGEIGLEEAVTNIKRDTRHFAKRQLTWLKRDKNIKWVKDYKEAEKLVSKFLKD